MFDFHIFSPLVLLIVILGCNTREILPEELLREVAGLLGFICHLALLLSKFCVEICIKLGKSKTIKSTIDENVRLPVVYYNIYWVEPCRQSIINDGTHSTNVSVPF